jgi:hypothetical protein
MNIQIGDIFRYARPYASIPDEIDGFPNFFHVTNRPGSPLYQLERGINSPAEISAPDGVRRPVILIASSPHKVGADETPWKDFFDSDNGHILYFGDNKKSGQDPAKTIGNRNLLEAYQLHSSPTEHDRIRATPIVFFERVKHNGAVKGYVRFQGFGLISGVQLVTQVDMQGNYFANYAFEFLVLTMAREHELFDWSWINKRRDRHLTAVDTLAQAPQSWKTWIKKGAKAFEQIRRRISNRRIEGAVNQRPVPGSAEDKTLRGIYAYYERKKHRFESLASLIAQRVLGSVDGTYQTGLYTEGWITRASGDGGSDFVGKLEIGSHFSKTQLVVLGQAKCEALYTPTSVVHIARTVARLKRGWVGVFVTTSYFSDATQREVIEDAYPIVLIHGLRLALETNTLLHQRGIDLNSLLDEIDAEHDRKVQMKRPEEILLS